MPYCGVSESFCEISRTCSMTISVRSLSPDLFGMNETSCRSGWVPAAISWALRWAAAGSPRVSTWVAMRSATSRLPSPAGPQISRPWPSRPASSAAMVWS